MPQTDEGEVRVEVEGEVGTRLDVMDTGSSYRSHCGQGSPRSPQRSGQRGRRRLAFIRFAHGHMRIALGAVEGAGPFQRTDRNGPSSEALGIPGVTVRTRAGQGMFMMRMGTGGSERVQVDVRGHDLEVADALAAEVGKVLGQVPGVTDVPLSQESAPRRNLSASTGRKRQT